MLFTIVHPSRNRPKQFKETFKLWATRFNYSESLEYIVSLDNNDDKLSEYNATIDFLEKEYKCIKIKKIVSDNDCVVSAVNSSIKLIEGEMVVVVSDDFECPSEWNLQLLYRIPCNQKMYAFMVSDGIQSYIQTLPIVSKTYIDEFGYIYYPKYKSLYSDQDLSSRCYLMDIMVDARDLIFKHNHYTVMGIQPDETYRRENSESFREIGLDILKERIDNNFGVPDKLMKIYLSILIPSMFSRDECRNKLIESIRKQASKFGYIEDKDFEIILDIDDGVLSVGHKRNKLLSKSKGMYSVFIDDDDEISEEYLHKVISVIKEKPFYDCFGFKGQIIFTNTGDKRMFIHSIENSYEERNSIYYRPPNHLNPIRTNIAKNVEFPHIDICEDKNWCLEIQKMGLLKNEYFIKEPIMYYYFSTPR